MFDGPTFQGYYGEIGRIIRAQLDKESPDYLRQVDCDEPRWTPKTGHTWTPENRL